MDLQSSLRSMGFNILKQAFLKEVHKFLTEECVYKCILDSL